MGTDRLRQAFIYALDDEVGSVTEISERLVVRITFNYDRFGGCVRELQVGLRAVIEGLDELHALAVGHGVFEVTVVDRDWGSSCFACNNIR